MRKRVTASIWLFVVLLFLYAPILVLAVYSFTEATMIGQVRGFSLQNYVTLFTNEDLVSIITGTFGLAFVVSVLSTILGTLGAIGAFYSRKRYRLAYDLANQIPVVNADVVTGFSICILLIVFFGMDKNTYIPLVIGQMALCTPFVYLSVLPRLKQMDPRLYEAALDLGCTPRQALQKVVFREVLPGMISGFMTAIMLSLDDYFIATYTKPAVFDTISTYVVNATKGSQTEIKTALWALSTVIFVVIAVAVVISNLAGRDKASEEGNR
ncbi:MAG: ABC transporter permease [Lachnospiraceae bacterium]|nr:ABC transporter permease [Lachnospiraceae bacterium]